MVLLPHYHRHLSVKFVSAAFFHSKYTLCCRVFVIECNTPETFEFAESSANNGLGTKGLIERAKNIWIIYPRVVILRDGTITGVPNFSIKT